MLSGSFVGKEHLHLLIICSKQIFSDHPRLNNNFKLTKDLRRFICMPALIMPLASQVDASQFYFINPERL